MKLRRFAKWTVGVVLLAVLATFGIAYVTSTNACGRESGSPGPRMKAVIRCDYGPPEVLKIEDIEKPAPADGQVLVRIHAASVNPLDWHDVRGTPYFARFDFGLRKPSEIRVGVDYAGTVEAVGKDVTHFKPGDDVFGGRTGAFAEYVSAREGGAIALKPTHLSFEQAATAPIAAITALQGLDKGKVQRGDRVLINGASGGVGTFAVQIARSRGADVTGVCSSRNVALVRSLGADRVIDYTREDFTAIGERWDVIIDNVGNHSLWECKRALTPRGRYVMIGGQPGRWIDPLPRVVGARLLSRFVSQDMTFLLAELNQRDLNVVRDLMQAGEVTPVIDRRYSLRELPSALRYLEEGHARGKVVITVE